MNNPTNPNDARTVGRHVLFWAQASDWYKKVHKRSPDDSKNNKSPSSDSHSDTESKNTSTKQADSKPSEEKKLKDVVKESSQLLIKAHTVFPFTPFPTHLTMDRHKLTLVYHRFLGAQLTVSVPLENIKNIQADLGPLFGSLIITSDQFINNTQEVKYLSRNDALRIQRIVQGAIVATGENVDLSKVDAKKLCKMLEDLGGAHAL